MNEKQLMLRTIGNRLALAVLVGVDAPRGIGEIFAIQSAAAADCAKMLFRCFLAGFSERFATDIMSRFESRAGDGRDPGR